MTIPSIAAVNSNSDRPQWPVMIPIYHPDIEMLREAIRGPIASRLDRTDMQIALVDDGSDLDWNSASLQPLAQECRDNGVEIHKFAANLGLAGNWNRCLNLARGQLVHVLHQDDRVDPTFYAAASAGFEGDTKIGAAFTQNAFINREGRRIRYGHLRSDTPCVLDDWLEYVFANLAIQCSAMVVKRTVYERLGGFNTNYRYCPDHEMWERIAVEYPLWFDPRPLSDFRVHNRSASSDLLRRSRSWLEMNRCATETVRRISAPARLSAMRTFRRHTMRRAVVAARQAASGGDWRGAIAIVRGAAPMFRLREIYDLNDKSRDRILSSRAPDRPSDDAAPRNPRILLLTGFFPWDPVRSVFGAFQRLGRHVRVLNRLGPVDVVFFSPAVGQLSQSDISARSAIARKAWSFRGSVHFVTSSEPKNLLDRLSDSFWTVRGFVGFGEDGPDMDTCRRQQVDGLEHIMQVTQPDLIFAYRLSTAVPMLRMKAGLPPIVVDLDDLESVRLDRLAGSRPRLTDKLKARYNASLARRAQRRISAIAASVIVCSDIERLKVQAMRPTARVATVPNTAAVLGVPPPALEPVALFVGTARYPPNREAILWFTNEVWPHIRRAVPQARFIVVGEKTIELGITSSQDGIEALGFVENLAPIYAAAMLAVCPIRRGSGTRIKIIEASINGRPVVSTTVGAEGLAFVPGTEILIDDDAIHFADACIRLLRNPAEATAIGEAARRRAKSAYRESWITERLRAICTSALRHEYSPRFALSHDLKPVSFVEDGERI